MKNGLTPRRKRFCEFYVANGGNGTAAAKEAGYKPDNAVAIAGENLTKPAIQRYIAELNEPGQNARIASAQERQEFWTSVVRGEEASRTDHEGLPELDMKDRLKASELLGRSQLDFVEKRIIDVSINVADQLTALKQAAVDATSD